MNRLGGWRIVLLLAALLIVLGVVIAGGYGWHSSRLAAARWDADTAVANARARADSTRSRLIRERDSIFAIHERLIEQGAVQLEDALNVAGEVPRLRQQLQIAGAQLQQERQRRASFKPAPGDSSGLLVLGDTVDALDSLGIRVAALAEVSGLPRPALEQPLLARWGWTIERAPALFTFSLSCEGHQPVSRLLGPSWARVDLTGGKVDPAACLPKPAPWRPFSFEAPSIPIAAALLTVGGILGFFIGQ